MPPKVPALLLDHAHPVFQPYDTEFATRLSWKLCGCVVCQRFRRLKYREAADKWTIGRTPPEIKEKYDAEIKALEEGPSANSSDKDGDGDGGDGRAGPKKGITAPGPSRRSPRVPWLPTPPQSADDPPHKPRGRKRRRNPEENDEEKNRPRKIRVWFIAAREDFAAKNALSNRLPEKRQKRRWAQDFDDEVEENKEQPSKTHATTTTRTGRRPTPYRPRQPVTV